MPTIFDNIETPLVEGLRVALKDAKNCAFCVGYLHLRGWGSVADLIDRFEGSEDSCCRLLVGMQKPDEERMHELQGLAHTEQFSDGPTLALWKLEIATRFKKQLEWGVPSDNAQAALRQLACQLRSGKVRVKAFLKHLLHAKLYLVERDDPVTPLVGFVGSSNLTLAGISHQGELNVDVLDQDAARKLLDWFNERWNDPMSFDITAELAQMIEKSWAGVENIRPYLVYLKIAYQLSEEARTGERDLKLPKVFQGVLLDFQKKAVLLAAHHLHKRGGVLLGDVVGLGKTLMAIAVAKVFQEDDGTNTLIICPPKLEEMWCWYKGTYGLAAEAISPGKVLAEMPHLSP